MTSKYPQNRIGDILHRIEEDGMEIDRFKTVDADRELIEARYHEHRGKVFYDALVDWVTDTVIGGIVEGDNAAERMRVLAGDTESDSAGSGMIRGDFADDSYD